MTPTELRAATRQLRDAIGLRDEPIAFSYSGEEPDGYRPRPEDRGCVIGLLARTRRGQTVYFDREHTGCPGGGYYLGFTPPMPRVEHFVSTGIPGEMPGERYKKSPELVRAYLEGHPPRAAPAEYAVFRPLSALAGDEQPEVVICFANADELAGLVGLANFAREDDAVICPFGSGCGTMVTRALHEANADRPRAVLGMFDPSARPCVQSDVLTFSAPVALWLEMLGNASESFLRTETWQKVRRRCQRERD